MTLIDAGFLVSTACALLGGELTALQRLRARRYEAEQRRRFIRRLARERAAWYWRVS